MDIYYVHAKDLNQLYNVEFSEIAGPKKTRQLVIIETEPLLNDVELLDETKVIKDKFSKAKMEKWNVEDDKSLAACIKKDAPRKSHIYMVGSVLKNIEDILSSDTILYIENFKTKSMDIQFKPKLNSVTESIPEVNDDEDEEPKKNRPVPPRPTNKKKNSPQPEKPMTKEEKAMADQIIETKKPVADAKAQVVYWLKIRLQMHIIYVFREMDKEAAIKDEKVLDNFIMMMLAIWGEYEDEYEKAELEEEDCTPLPEVMKQVINKFNEAWKALYPETKYLFDVAKNMSPTSPFFNLKNEILYYESVSINFYEEDYYEY